MSDPLTALMHAVQVMNLLKSLILKILREREDAAMGGLSPSFSSQSSEGFRDELMHSDVREVTSDDEYSSNGSSNTGVDDDDDENNFKAEDDENEHFDGDSISNLTKLSFQSFNPEVSTCREIILFDMGRITPHKQSGGGDLEV